MSAEQLQKLRALALEIVCANVDDRESLQRAIRAVADAIGIVAGELETHDRTLSEQAHALLEISSAGGAK